MGCFKLKNIEEIHSPFGMEMKSYVNAEYSGYRYGFNGKESENESFNGAYAFEARIYDARIGRWLSTDPREGEYAWQSTYAYFKNSPIAQLDYLGMGGEDDPPSPNNAPENGKEGDYHQEGPDLYSQHTWSHDGKSWVYIGTQMKLTKITKKKDLSNFTGMHDGFAYVNGQSGPWAPSYVEDMSQSQGFNSQVAVTPTTIYGQVKTPDQENKELLDYLNEYIYNYKTLQQIRLLHPEINNLQPIKMDRLYVQYLPEVLRQQNQVADGIKIGSVMIGGAESIAAAKIGMLTARIGYGIRVSGWVQRSVFNTLSPALKTKVISAIEKGIVSPTGRQGIIKLTKSEAAKTGYTHKIKILGKGGDIRIYGTQNSNGHFFFDKIMRH